MADSEAPLSRTGIWFTRILILLIVIGVLFYLFGRDLLS